MTPSRRVFGRAVLDSLLWAKRGRMPMCVWVWVWVWFWVWVWVGLAVEFGPEGLVSGEPRRAEDSW